MKWKKIVQLQEDKNDCAAASLLSIIKYYGGQLDMETVRELINTTKNGTNAYDIINGAKEIGFDAYGRKVSFADIEKQSSLLPLIAHVKKHNLYHFVVIYRIDERKEKILVMDPGIGMIEYKYKDFENMYLGVLLFFSKARDLPYIKQDNKILSIIFHGFKNNKRFLILLSVISLITFIFSLVDTVYYKMIFDNSFKDKSILIKCGIMFVLFVIIKNILIYLRNKLALKINYKMDYFVNKETLTRIFSLPISYYKNKSTGEIVSRINDLESLKSLISSLVLNTFVDVLLIFISFAFMLILNKVLTLVALFVIIIYFLIVIAFHRKINTDIRLVQESKGFYNHNLIETFDTLESINNLNIKNIRKEMINESYLSYSQLNKKIDACFINQNFLKGLVYDILMIVLLSIGGIMVVNKIISMGDLILIYMIITYFLGIIKSLLDRDLEISYTLRNMSKVNGMLVDKNVCEVNEELNGDIIIKNLSYLYGIDNVILNNLSFNIKYGEKILLTGNSGSGKSTLLRIIVKYLDNYKGLLFIDGKELRNINEDIIKNSFVYVSQNEKVFRDTFKNNILLGRNIKDVDYEKVLKICCLDDVRDSRKFKDEFMIESDGFNISGGERQRIVLARALLKKSNYIILDEALSEVNEVLEKKILSNIFEYYKEYTLIYVTHKEEIKKLFSKIYNVERR